MELGQNPCGVGRTVPRMPIYGRTEHICHFTPAALPTSVKMIKFGEKMKVQNFALPKLCCFPLSIQ